MPSGRTADFSYTDSNNPGPPAVRPGVLAPGRVVPSWSDGTPLDPRTRPAATPAPVPGAPPGRARGPRGRPDRRLVLAPGQGRSRGHRPPRGRERLHRGGHGRARPGSERPCSRRSWPGSRRPTCRCRCGRAPGSTTAAPWRAAATPSTAAGRRRPTAAGRDPMPRPDGIPAGEVVLLDENLLAEGHDYFAVGNLAVSPDHRLLVYSTDTTGGERYTMRFVDLADRQESPEALEDTSYGVAWANDNATVFYVRVDEAMRPLPAVAPPGRHRPGRRRPGLRGAGRPLLPRRGPHQGRPVRPAGPGLQGDLRGTGPSPPTSPTASSRVIEPRRQGVEYSVDHDRGDPARGPARPVPHRHQRRGRGLPADGGARRHPGAGPLARGDPGPARGPAGRRRPLRRPPGGLRARGR